MLNVALTGNIAAGKSSVVTLFRRWGATVIDADALAREAQAPGTDVLAAIGARFGADVLARDGSLDRHALRAKVMGDDAALAALNAIVHPAVQRRREELRQDAAGHGDVLVVNDIPLLFEVLDPDHFDVVVLVDAPVAVRRGRLRSARGLSIDEADRMIGAQMPAERKRERSEFVISNTGSPVELEAAARVVFDALRQRAAAAALGQPAGPVLLVAADAQDEPPAFAAVAARYSDAGVPIARVAGRATRVKLAALQPRVTLASARAAERARQAWIACGSPGTLLYASRDPDPVAVRLDLRPWGGARLALEEEGAQGMAARSDLFPAGQPLA